MHRTTYRMIIPAAVIVLLLAGYRPAAAQFPAAWGAESDGIVSNGPGGVFMAARLVNVWNNTSGLADARECQRELQRYTIDVTPGTVVAGTITLTIRATWLLEPQQGPFGPTQPFVDIGTTVAVPFVVENPPVVTVTTAYRADEKLFAATHGGSVLLTLNDPANPAAFSPDGASVAGSVSHSTPGVGPALIGPNTRIFIGGRTIFLAGPNAPPFDCTLPLDWSAEFGPDGTLISSNGVAPGELTSTPTAGGFNVNFARDQTFVVPLTSGTQSYILGMERRLRLVTVATPEPTSLAFLLSGGLGMAGLIWRRRKSV